MFGLKRKKRDTVRYKQCPMCETNRWVPRGSGEMVERYGKVYLRQYHQCAGCGTRFNLIRLITDNEWHFTHHAAAIRA